jgi:heat shock protein HtpX
MYSAIAANKRNTVVILIVFLVLLGGLGWLIALFMGDGS